LKIEVANREREGRKNKKKRKEGTRREIERS
jgi:hypothetical protein